MLTQIKIEGFKCFNYLDISMTNLNLLTGANSSGKSSMIQSILLLLQQKEQKKNPLNGKYVTLGLIQDVKNIITNPRSIKIEIKDYDKEEEICTMQLNTKGEIKIQGRELLLKKDFVYLSAERIGAEDVYKQNLTDEYRIGIHGEYAFDYLSRERMNELRELDFQHQDAGVNLGNQVDYWLNYILGYYVTAERIMGTEVVKVSYRRADNNGIGIKPHHVGTGLSYVANVIISALSCKKGSLFIIENPEIHLHPGAQSKLLEFFSFLASKGLQIVIETHSDHIFNGVRKRIKAQDILSDDVSVYFFKLDKNYLSEAVKINISENGKIENHEIGLFDQFDEDLDELLGL
jgi:predicted ATPase